MSKGKDSDAEEGSPTGPQLLARRDRWRKENIGGGAGPSSKGGATLASAIPPSSSATTASLRSYTEEFPSIADSNRRRAKARGFGVPIDTEVRGFKSTAAASFFPFEEVKSEKIKPKSIPIELCWSSKDTAKPPWPQMGKVEAELKTAGEIPDGVKKEGSICQRPWFRLPETRVTNRQGGEREVDESTRSCYGSSFDSTPIKPPKQIKSGEVPILQIQPPNPQI